MRIDDAPFWCPPLDRWKLLFTVLYALALLILLLRG